MRDEVVFAWSGEPIPDIPEHSSVLRLYSTFDEIREYKSAIDAEYHPGYTDRWQSAFGWGEQLALLLDHGKPIGFGWLQSGGKTRSGSHWGPLREGEYRIGRVGVVPSHRRQGYNSLFYRMVLAVLAENGASRVYVESSKDNLPSIRAISKGGFRPIGTIRVLGRLAPQYVRWLRFDATVDLLDSLSRAARED